MNETRKVTNECGIKLCIKLPVLPMSARFALLASKLSTYQIIILIFSLLVFLLLLLSHFKILTGCLVSVPALLKYFLSAFQLAASLLTGVLGLHFLTIPIMTFCLCQFISLHDCVLV